MKAHIKWQFSLNTYTGQRIVALSEECVIVTDTYGQRVFVVSEGEATEIEIEKTRRRRSVEEMEEDMGVAFAYKNGVGISFQNKVYLWDDMRASSKKITIRNPHKPDFADRRMQPLAARQIPNSNEIFVLLSDYYSSGGRYFCKLDLDGSKAQWSTKPQELNYKDFQGLIKTQGVDVVPGEYWPFIHDLLPVSGKDVLVHTTGHECNWARYGMDYSAIAQVNERGRSKILQEVEHGYGRFSSDAQNLIVQHLKGKPVLSFYDLKGSLVDSLRLTPKSVLGNVIHHTLRYDKYGTSLWLADGRGEITCCEIMG